MADPRAELEHLRKLKRVKELEAKAGIKGASPAADQQATSAGQSALEGFGQTASMGYLPQLQAGASQAFDKVTGALGVGPAGADAKLRAQGFKLPAEETYLEARDANIARQAQQSKDSPTATLLGKGAGIVTTAMASPFGSAARGASLGKAIATGAAQGAVQGAAYNPGDTPGVYEGVGQAGPRAANAALGGVLGGTMSAVGKGVSNLADRGKMISRVKDSANLSGSVREEIGDAVQGVKDKYIAPREAKLQQYLQGKKVEVNPESIAEQFPNYAAKLTEKQGLAGTVNPRASIPANRALRLRRGLDAKADYGPKALFDPASASKNEGARRSADMVRGKLSDLGPEVGEIQGEVAQALNATKSLSRSAKKTPIAAISGKPGTDKGSLVDLVDQLGGSSLEKTAQGIKQAKESLLNPINLVKPLEFGNEVRKLGLRGGILGGQALDKLPEGTQEALLRGLFETKR